MEPLCVTCNQPLIFKLDDEDPTSADVPDDVQLHACNHHFHWQCLIDGVQDIICPFCGADLRAQKSAAAVPSDVPNREPISIQVLCTLNNEGGVQDDLDIFPPLLEESHLKRHPEERKARAFLEFCREGDLSAVVELLQNDDDSDYGSDDGDEMILDGRDKSRVDILRYQDTLGDGQSALHDAVVGGSHEIAWLLLYLASALSLELFPPDLVEQVQTIGFVRDDLSNKPDIRSLRDKRGRSAENWATDERSTWTEWLGNQRLNI